MQDEPKPQERSDEFTITIKVTGDGDFTYEPAVKRLKAGQTVTWSSSQGPFSISFKDGTPFDQLDYHSEEKGDGAWAVTTCGVDDLADPGHFHYSVAIYLPNERLVRQDSACPEIIIN